MQSCDFGVQHNGGSERAWRRAARGWALRMLGALLLVMGGAVGVGAQDIRVVTEDYPPYNYAKDAVVVGVSTDVVRAVLAKVGVDAPIELMPWARAYDLAQGSENVLIYSITRTPAREALFKWVGQVAPSEWFLYSLRGHELGLKTLDDAKRYRIATVYQAVGEQFLLERGFDRKRNLQSSNRYAHNYEKLKLGRVDLWVSNGVVADYLVRQAGDDPDQQLTAELKLDELGGDGLYMAFSLNTPDALVERFREALDALRREGRLPRPGSGKP